MTTHITGTMFYLHLLVGIMHETCHAFYGKVQTLIYGRAWCGFRERLQMPPLHCYNCAGDCYCKKFSVIYR